VGATSVGGGHLRRALAHGYSSLTPSGFGHVNQPQADLDGLVDLGHRAGVDHPQTLDQSLPVHGSDLVQAYGGADIKTIGAGRFNHSFQ